MNTDFPFLEVPASLDAGRVSLRPEKRMPSFIGVQGDAAKRLRGLRAVIIGVGSIGGRIAEDMARWNIETLWIVDPKSFKPESLLTHAIGPREVDLPKARVVAYRCKQLSPRTRVLYFEGPVQALPADSFGEAQIVSLASDNLSCEDATGQRCTLTGRPLVHASVHGESLTAVVRFFGNASPEGPCPCCLYGEGERAALESERQFSCAPETGASRIIQGPPTMSVSSLCAMAAAMAGQQILRHTLGLGAGVGDTYLEYNAYTHLTSVASLARHPACPCEHRAAELRTARQPLADCSVSELLELAGFPDQRTGISLTLEGWDWIETAVCSCGAATECHRFMARDEANARSCPACGAPMMPHPFYRHRVVPVPKLEHVRQQPLRALGAVAPRTALIRADSRLTLVRNPQLPRPQ